MSQKYVGEVVGLKNIKTATVELSFTKLHPKYHKPVRRKKTIQAHNEEHNLQLGDRVEIKSSRPYSATKRFLVIKKVESK
jgi:small subunit ribosomal protein S17